MYSNNYVLDTEIVKTKSSRRSRSLSVTSNRKSGKGSDPTKNPSIRPFLKPTGASTKMGQNEAWPKPKVATAKSCSESKIVENEALPKSKVAADKHCSKTKHFELTPSPSVIPVLKPVVASLEGGPQNNSFLKPKTGSQMTDLEEASGSQKRLSDFFLIK